MQRTAWRDVEEVAHTLAPAKEWRSALATRLREAADASFVAVCTCAPDDWNRMWHDSDPAQLRHLTERVSREYVPRIERAGEGPHDALHRHGRIYAPLESARERRLAEELRSEILSPVEINGYVVAWFASGQPPRLYGFATLGARDGSAALLRRLGPLRSVVNAAAGTLGSALSLARECGAAFPVGAAQKGVLSAREQQVAALSAEGYANVNVAARLGIAEATVAVHLKSVYRKLGVHSRLELLAALREG